jgi:hypothetical protein
MLHCCCIYKIEILRYVLKKPLDLPPTKKSQRMLKMINTVLEDHLLPTLSYFLAAWRLLLLFFLVARLIIFINRKPTDSAVQLLAVA